MSRPWTNTDEKYHEQYEEKESLQTADHTHSSETPKTEEISKNLKISQSKVIPNMDQNPITSENSNKNDTLNEESPKFNRALQNMLRRIQVRELEQQIPQPHLSTTGSMTSSFQPNGSSVGYSSGPTPGLPISNPESSRYDSSSPDQLNRVNVNLTQPGQNSLGFRSLAAQQSGQVGNDIERSQYEPLQQTAWRNPLRNAEKVSNSDEITDSRNTTSFSLPPPPRNPPPISPHQIIRKDQTFSSFRSPPSYSAQNEKYPFGVPPIPPRVHINRHAVSEQESERSLQYPRDHRMTQLSNNPISPTSANLMNSLQLQDAQTRRYFSRRPLIHPEQTNDTTRVYYEADPRNDPDYQFKIRANFPRSSPVTTEINQLPEMNLDSSVFQESQTEKISTPPELSPEEKAQRNTSILANLPIIQQNEPLKYLVLTILMDGRAHTETDLLRKLKKNGKFLGSVALGMLIYHMIEIFGTDMIDRTFPCEEAVYKLSDRFQQLCKQIFSSNLTSNSNSTSLAN